MKPLSMATYNIHKGMSPLNRRVQLGEIARALDTLSADVVFLQEVQGRNALRALKHDNWPRQPQHQFLARELGSRATYGLNASYDHGHHGNAVLSRFPVVEWCNLDISVNRFESRGILHCLLQPSGWKTPVLALCAHLNLLSRDRRKQFEAVTRYLEHNVPPSLPLILAGDFNDWRDEASRILAERAGLTEVFRTLQGECAKSFPARMPMLPLARIYVRGLRPLACGVHRGQPWARLSDHLPLSAQLLPA